MFYLVPLVVSVLFWYSPRYRLPAIPFIVVSCVWSVTMAIHTRRPAWMIAVAASVLGGFVLGGVNRMTGFDHPDSQSPSLEYNMGLVLLRQDRAVEAADSFMRVLEQQPDHVDAMSKLAGLFAGQGMLIEAEDLCRRVLAVRPEDAEASTTLGSICSETGRVEEARTLLEAAVASAPDYVEAHYNLGVNLLRQGRPEEAAARFERCLELDANHVKALANSGGLLASAGRLEEAWTYFQRALAVDPGSAQLQRNVAALLMQMGRPAEAMKHLSEAVRLAPANARHHQAFGLALLNMGETKAAIRHLGEAARLAPNEPGVALDLAWLLATHADDSVRDGERAVLLAEKAMSLLESEEPAALEILAAAKAEAGDFDAAVEAARRAVDLAEQRDLSQEADAARRRLEGYQAGTPYRE
jgi:tetratricopeptide (TPR) repeat protein